MSRLLLCLLCFCFCGSASLLSCDLAWVPIRAGATNKMTLGSYRVNMTFSGTVSIDGTVPTDDFSDNAVSMAMLFSVSDSATGSNVTTLFKALAAVEAKAWLFVVPQSLSVTIFSGNSLLLEPPSYFKENVTYTFFYTRPLVSTTSVLFVGGAAQSSFSCSVTMGRIPRMYQMSQIATFAAGDCRIGNLIDLVTPLFVFSEPIQSCGTGARFSSTNVRSYDGNAYSCPLWSYADGGRIWWCATQEPSGGDYSLLRYIRIIDAVFKPVEFVSVCTVNGNIPIVTDDMYGRTSKTSLFIDTSASCNTELSARLYNPVMNLTSSAIEAILPLRSHKGPLNDSLTTRYYETGGFANDYEAQTFPSLNYPALINAVRSGSVFYPSINGYQYTIAGPGGFTLPRASALNVTVINAVPAVISQASCWMEYSSDLARFATVCRFYTSTWIVSVGIRLVTSQTPTVDALAAGTLELDTSNQIYDNAYRTIRSNLTFLPSGMQTYLSHTNTGLFAFIRAINVTLLDSTPLTLSSVKYGTFYDSLVFTFADCNSELLGVAASRIISECTLDSTFTLISSCVVEIPILDTTLCQMENISTLFDVAWTTQQVSPYSQSEVTVDKSDVYPDFPIQVVSAYLTDRTHLFVDLTGVVSTETVVDISQLTLSCGTVTSGVFHATESTVELNITGCPESSTNLTIGGTAFTSATQTVFPATLTFANWRMQAVSAYLVDRTRLFVKLVDLVSTDITVNVSQLTLSCGEISGSGVFYPDESFAELTISGCNETSTNLTIDGLAFTSTTQTIVPVTLITVFMSPFMVVVPESSGDCTLADVSIGYVLAISLAPVGGLVLLYGLARFFANSKLPFTGSQRRRRR